MTSEGENGSSSMNSSDWLVSCWLIGPEPQDPIVVLQKVPLGPHLTYRRPTPVTYTCDLHCDL